MIKVVVVGATGYAGEELLKILVGHPEVRITNLIAKIDEPAKISSFFPALTDRLDMTVQVADNSFESVMAECDIAFLAVPHVAAKNIAPIFIKAGKKVIDLSADYRLKDAVVYKEYYKSEHTDLKGLEQAVYGLPELYKTEIKNAQLIANPGCYPTSVILGAVPLVKKGLLASGSKIIADSKTGVTGAGRNPQLGLHFPEVNENTKAYKIFEHQHQPEMAQELSLAAGRDIKLIFTPHLLPINRGILSTLYLDLNKDISTADVLELYQDFYTSEPFIRIKAEGEYPQIKDVVNANFCDIGLQIKGKTAIVISAIDNLTKGASGQAVQNLNLLCGFEETLGLL